MKKKTIFFSLFFCFWKWRGQLKEKHLNMKQDVGLYTCGARNELSGRGERAKGVVYLSIEQGGRFVNNLSFDVMMRVAKKCVLRKLKPKIIRIIVMTTLLYVGAIGKIIYFIFLVDISCKNT